MDKLFELLRKTKYRLNIVIATPILLGLFLGNMMVIQPGLSKLKQSENEIKNLSKKEASFNNILQSEKRLSDYGWLNTSKIDKAALIGKVNEFAQATKLSISSIIPSETGKSNDYFDEVTINIDADGDFHQLGQFISRVESMDPLVALSNLSVSGNANQTGYVDPMAASESLNILKISMTIVMYVPLEGTL